MARHDPAELAQTAYAAYGDATGHTNYRGEPMPAWEDLGYAIQQAWAAAAAAVFKAVTSAPGSED